MPEVRLSMSEMEPQLGDSFKVCGFCSQLTEQAESLSPDMITFMSQFLNMPVVRLPAKMCPECLKRSISARKFSEKCRRAIEKLEKNGLTGGMVWGKSESLSTGGGVEYDWRIHGPLKFPRITITAGDRDRADYFLARRQLDSEEVFPAEGPFECEMCHEVNVTKQDFVDHIKKFHINVVDDEVLKSLESDLKKSRKKAAKQATLQNGTGSKNFHKAATEPKSSPSKSPQKGKTLEELSPRYVLPLPQIV